MEERTVDFKHLDRIMSEAHRSKLILDFMHVQNILRFMITLLEENPGTSVDYLRDGLTNFYNHLAEYVTKDIKQRIDKFLNEEQDVS